MKNHDEIINTYYGSWEKLLDLINQKLDFYLQIPRVFALLKLDALRPGNMLDDAHPAYFSDAIARHCLATYEPQESMDSALERCIVHELRRQTTCMKHADMSMVRMDESIWMMFTLEALLRLIWRKREAHLQIPVYLQKESRTKLSALFLLEAENGCVRLTQCTHSRFYEADAAQLDWESFCRQMHCFFRLATEDYGYFVPEFVWLATEK